MDNDDVIEKPTCQKLYRQSSLETRLSPVHLSEESDTESPDDEEKTPKIIDYKIKSENAVQHIIAPSPLSRKCVSEKKSRYQEDLEKKLQKPLPQKYLTSRNSKEQSYVHADDPLEKIKFSSTKATDAGLAFQDELKRKFQEKHISSNVDEKTNRIKPAVPARTLSTNIGLNIISAKENEALKVVGKNSKTSIVIHPNNSVAPDVPCEVDEDDDRIITTEESSQDKNKTFVGLLKALITTKTSRTNVEETTETVGCSTSGREQMATARPKSPRPVGVRGEKDESIWDKLGTLGRKKRIKEVQEVQAEGKYAIDSPGCPTAPIIPPEEYNLDDNEERCMIDRRAYDDSKFNELINVLKEWINDELASQRIIVQDLSEDLYDGQVLQKLLEKLTGDKLDVPEVTQSEEGQKQKLSVVLGHFNQVLGIQRITHNKWSVEAIHSKNIVAIIHLLVALARHFRPPVRLPEHVSVDVVVVQKAKGLLNHKVVRESLTKAYEDVGMRCERDAFDTLFDHAPDKLQVVKKSLVTFVNKHLNKMNFEVTEIESQFHDGVYLIMLMGLLEGFFVPHYSFNLTPHEFDQKVHNVNFAFELMEEVGLQKPKARPEDVVNMDLKSTLRVLYNLFLKYKTIL